MVEGRCLRLGPGWAVLLSHLAQRPESILGAVSTPVKWGGGGGGWGCYGPCDSRDIKSWPAKTFLADQPVYASWAWKGCGARRDVWWPGPLLPFMEPQLSDPLLPGGTTPWGAALPSVARLYGDNSREEGYSSSEGGAVEGLGTGPHPGLSLLGHPG